MGSRGKYTIEQPGVKGTILGVRQLQDRGRLQVPKEVRKELGIMEGDDIYWLKGTDGRIYVMKATEIV